MHTKYYQAISKISKFLLGVNVSWICLSLKRKFWKQMFIYIVCQNNVVKSFLKLHFYFLIPVFSWDFPYLWTIFATTVSMHGQTVCIIYPVEVAGLFNLWYKNVFMGAYGWSIPTKLVVLSSGSQSTSSLCNWDFCLLKIYLLKIPLEKISTHCGLSLKIPNQKTAQN